MPESHRRSASPWLILVLIAVPAPLLAGGVPVADARALHGELGEVDGMPVLTLWGTQEERGFSEGYLLADAIVDLVRGFCLSKRVVPNPKLWDMTIVYRVKEVVTVPERLRRRYAAVLEGVTARLGKAPVIAELERTLTVDDLVAFAAIPDITGLLCSSFAAWDEAATGDGLLVGRSLDYFATGEFMRRTMIIVNAADGERRGWVSIGWPGLHGCVTGISDAGVLVAIHDVPRMGRREARFTPRLIALTELIERLDPADAEASGEISDVAMRGRDILRQFHYGMGGNVMLAWHTPSTRGACVLEIDGNSGFDSGVSLRLPEGQSYIACSNHHRLRGQDRRHCRRYRTIWQRLEGTSSDSLDLTSGWELIRAAGQRNTIYRLVTDLGEGQVRMERRLAPRKDPFVEHRFDVRRLLENASRRAAASRSAAL